MLKRGTFIAFSGSTLCVKAWAKNGKRRVVAKLAVPAVPSSAITKFVAPLLIPPAMPQAGKLKRKVKGQAKTQTAN
jgi:hypothetical protein